MLLRTAKVLFGYVRHSLDEPFTSNLVISERLLGLSNAVVSNHGRGLKFSGVSADLFIHVDRYTRTDKERPGH